MLGQWSLPNFQTNGLFYSKTILNNVKMMVRRQFKEETAVQFRLSSVAQKRRVLKLPNKAITHHSPVLRYVQGSVSRKSKERFRPETPVVKLQSVCF